MRQTAFLLLLLGMVAALGHVGDDDNADENGTTAPTSVWVTTTVNGALATIQAQYTQSFQPVASLAAEVPSGGIGLGSLSGEVGNARTYDSTTVSGGAAGITALGGVFVALGGLLL